MSFEQLLPLDKNGKETIYYHNEILHYSLYPSLDTPLVYSDIPWHWHDAFEFGFVISGTVLYRTNHCAFTLQAGDAIFINSGIPHALYPLEPRKALRFETQFFDREFLAGTPGSLIDLKYIEPVRKTRQLEAFPLYACDPDSRVFSEKLLLCASLAKEKSEFFEMRLRSVFSELWELIYTRAEAEKKAVPQNVSERNHLIKQLLSYVQEHFAEQITVLEIANSAHISERECFRVFRNYLGITPIDFLQACRLQEAQKMLIYSEKSILEIALECGFGNSSYFGKRFKAVHRITPNQYRKLRRKEASP